jgi:hypothetical protein
MTIWAVKALEPSLRVRATIVPIFPHSLIMSYSNVVLVVLLYRVRPVEFQVGRDGGQKYDKIREEYDAVVPQRRKWVKMGRKWYEISRDQIRLND